ncbi:tetratricopeptide repeat-containing sensor histidine kinase [Sphingobacterium sp. xlx-130]|uniref:tetratricopeptide repeat-containing sensor histidine kinase n=1 Tax=Sphingobacterium sp. xlx-130 TaxID=2654323 RepID=UPI0013D96643|nr:tetratricopeptide repeat-containing sensor histidine kinase [Sphingobacterium sp. xlx-130]
MKKKYLLWVIFILCSCSDREIKQEPVVSLDLSKHYRDAFDYLERGRSDSAFVAFEKIKSISVAAKDSFNIAKSIIQMAFILRDVGDHYASQESSLEANVYLDSTDFSHATYLSSNYNNLARATSALGDVESALNFYDKAIQYSTDSLDTKVFFNNKAKTLSDVGRGREALKIYEQILKNKNKNNNEYARSLTNYAVERGKLDKKYDPLADLHRALRIRLARNDQWGINSSFNHLTLYYEDKSPDSALHYAKMRCDIATRLKNPDERLKALYQLIAVSSDDDAKSLFDRYKKLGDSLQRVRSKSKNQFALIRYEVEQDKSANLKLEKDINDKLYRINMQRLLTIGGGVIFAILGGFGYIWYNRRKQRLLLENNNRVKEHQLKTSRKVHDVVANGLYRVMAEIENRDDIDRESILDRLEGMYEKSRDISYEGYLSDGSDVQLYRESLGNMLRSFATENRRVVLAGIDLELWAAVSVNVKNEIDQVLQELMVNMRKHSEADRVVVRFEQTTDLLHIYYTDNGIGLSSNIVWGNGLNSIVNRVKSIDGKITFVNEKGGGMKVHISIPVL